MLLLLLLVVPFTERLEGGKAAAIHRCRAMDLFRGDVTGCSPPPRLRCIDAAFIHKITDETEPPASVCIKPSRCFVGRSAEQEASVSRVLLVLLSAFLASSSLLPTRLTPKVALIGMGSDSHPLRLRNF